MGTFFLHVLLGVEADDSLNLPGGHIPCMDVSFLHGHGALPLDLLLKLTGGHIHCMSTSFIHVLFFGVE